MEAKLLSGQGSLTRQRHGDIPSKISSAANACSCAKRSVSGSSHG